MATSFILLMRGKVDDVVELIFRWKLDSSWRRDTVDRMLAGCMCFMVDIENYHHECFHGDIVKKVAGLPHKNPS